MANKKAGKKKFTHKKRHKSGAPTYSKKKSTPAHTGSDTNYATTESVDLQCMPADDGNTSQDIGDTTGQGSSVTDNYAESLQVYYAESESEMGDLGHINPSFTTTQSNAQVSTRAIKSLITFLLEEGVEYINPRVFTQDPLEQHFSKVRAGQGGSNNSNYQQTLYRNRALHTIGQPGVKKRKGNSGECSSSMDVTTEKLPKRKCTRGIKFSLP